MRTMTFFSGILLSAITLVAPMAATTAHAAGGPDYSQTGFVLRESALFSPVAADLDSPLAQPFTRPVGSELAIIESRDTAQFGQLLHIGLDVNPAEGLPSDFWVRAASLPQEILEPYAPADEAEGDLAILKAMTYCYRYVKQYLLQTGRVSSYLPGESAWMAASLLPKYGFHRTGHSPASAANGEVCVYSGGPQGHGHIEIKRGGMWWYGYGMINHPMRGRRFIACFNK